eukprot:TRINITY_DN5667_c0_g1_i1.p1 TRINITY_DN5667_c0_g1~~TRINITY_DN5667_c0_g1_i1.p1  ORF type:complete len:319 (-),score=46.64 TRINITY_DN5667_c0_g1_i1:87-1043(-)
MAFAFVVILAIITATFITTNGEDGSCDKNNIDDPWSYTVTNDFSLMWSSCYPTCGLSINPTQSPINIQSYSTKESKGPLEDILINDPSIVTIHHTNQKLKIKYPDDYQGGIRVNGEMCELKEIHFHTPAEHTFIQNEKIIKYQMEMHMVHLCSINETAVLSVWWSTPPEATPHPWLDYITETLSSSSSNSPSQHLTVSIPPITPYILPSSSHSIPTYWTYPGSVTTPPCTSPVKWFGLVEPMQCTLPQLATIHLVLGNNSRPIQRELSQVELFRSDDTEHLLQVWHVVLPVLLILLLVALIVFHFNRREIKNPKIMKE